MITDYQFPMYNRTQNNHLLLTTSQSFSILNDDAILIDYFLNQQSISRINEKANNLIKQIKDKQLKENEEKYLRKFVNIEKEYDSIKNFLKDNNLKKPDRNYEFVTDIQVLLFPTMNDGDSYIDVYSFNHSITYRNKRVKKIIFSNYNKKEMNIAKFHEYLTYLMNS